MASQARVKGTTNPEELSDRNNNIYSRVSFIVFSRKALRLVFTGLK